MIIAANRTLGTPRCWGARHIDLAIDDGGSMRVGAVSCGHHFRTSASMIGSIGAKPVGIGSMGAVIGSTPPRTST
jgi:hypothetical protein